MSSTRIRETIGSWQQRLLQLDHRNKLLYFKPDSAAVVEIVTEKTDDLLEQLESSRRGLSFDFQPTGTKQPTGWFTDPASEPEPDTDTAIQSGDLVTKVSVRQLQTRLLRLRNKDREFREEQGLNVLFLACGLLHWIDENNVAAAAPLLLVPCTLERASPRDPFVLRRHEDEALSNVTLEYKLQSDLGFALPAVNFDAPPELDFQQVERAIIDKASWSVSRDVFLGTFQYSKMAMWEDLESLRNAEEIAHPMVRFLAGEAVPDGMHGLSGEEWFLQGEEGLKGGLLDDFVHPQDLPLVMPADYSQIQAIGAARTGQNLVIHGPPGTGKSQTIANLIGSFMADGKSVLFVSEKTAALDVVKRRLVNCGLGDFCLDLHSERARKANVYLQFAESLNASRESDKGQLDYSQLEAARGRLNAYVRALHLRRQPLGWSAYQAHGLFAAVRHLPDVDFIVEDPRALTPDSFATFTEFGQRIAAMSAEFEEHFLSKWLPLWPVDPGIGIPDSVRRWLAPLIASLSQLCRQAETVARWLGVTVALRASDVERQAAILELMQRCPAIEPTWLDADLLGRLLAAAAHQESAHEQRQSDLAKFDALFSQAPSSLPHLRSIWSLIEQTFADQAPVERVLGVEWSKRVCQEREGLFDDLKSIPPVATAAAEAGKELQTFLGLESSIQRTRLRHALEVAGEIVGLHVVPACWLEEEGLDRVVSPLVDSSEDLIGAITTLEAELFARFEKELLDDVDREMLLRFRLDYGSGLKRLISGRYRRDVRLIRSHLKGGDGLDHGDARHVVEVAGRLTGLRGQWAESEEELASVLGSRYRGRATDWKQIRHDISVVEVLLEDVDATGPAARPLLNSASCDELERLRSRLQQSVDDLAKLETRILGSAATDDQSTTLDLVPGAEALVPEFQRLDSIVRGLAPVLRGDLNNWIGLRSTIEAGQRVLDLEQKMLEERDRLVQDFGARFREWATDWHDIKAVLSWCQELAEKNAGQPYSSIFEAHLREPHSAEDYGDYLRDSKAALSQFDLACRHLEEGFDPARLPWSSWQEAPLEDLASWCAALQADAESANDWLIYRKAVNDLETEAGIGTVDAIRRATSDASEVPLILHRRLLEAWIDALNADEPVFGLFTAAEHESVRTRFEGLDRALPGAASGEVRRRVFSSYPAAVALTNAGELATLRSQITRKKGQLPVRRLLGRISALAKELKPCFMMSPLAVSQYLPRSTDGSYFGVVIFDEASQVFPEDAVPAISRAGQVIVVGDEKQLPPTSFFRRLVDDGGDGAGTGSEDDDDEDEEADALEGRDSILDAMLGKVMGSVAIERHLNVHYRSKHQDLIRFSNASFYDGRLHVYPSALRDLAGLGLRDQFVADGVYEPRRSSSGSQLGASGGVNQKEAQRVVDLVFDMLRAVPSDESLGVVALSRAQADLIIGMINNRRVIESDVDVRFAEDSAEPFFVKNLENVQGDERDHIILCVGYGPNAAGNVYQRFGPLNSDVGWRRLNVAVSRARRSMTVVHSTRSEQITATSAGARWLRSFLAFARDPEAWSRPETASISGADFDSDFEQAVSDALTHRGHNIRIQVGSAGYRVDLAILSEDGTRYDLGIECDGATYHSAPAARDRDVIRQSILESLGWRIHRVWSTDWIRNPGREIEAIEAALGRARAASSVPIHAAPPITRSMGTSGQATHPQAVTSNINYASQFLFPDYEMTSFKGLKHGADLRFETEENLAALLLDIAEREGPVHLEEVYVRLRWFYTMGQLREPDRQHVIDIGKRLAAGHKIVFHEPWIDLLDREARPRRPSANHRRRFEHIAPAELVQAVLQVTTAIFSASREELVVETARQLGYMHTSGAMQGSIEAALNECVSGGLLSEDGEGLIRRTAK